MLNSIAVVGASLAGLRAIETFRSEGFDKDIVLVGAEPHRPYNRPPLSKSFLAGTVDGAGLEFPGLDDLDIHWKLGRQAVSLVVDERAVVLDNGEHVRFDGLVIATGATPRKLQMVLPSSGVHQVRTYDDVLALKADLKVAQRVVIIGGGLVGTECASTMRGLGLDVSLVSPDPVLGRVLGDLAKAAARRVLETGVQVINAGVVALTGAGRVESVVLDDGRSLTTDVVVVAIGAAPEISWLDGVAPIRDGVVCDERMRVIGLEDVVAAGDVAQWPHPALGGELLRLEHWTNASQQGAAAARSLLHGDDAVPYAPLPSFWTDQFGTRIQGIGLVTPGDQAAVISGDAAGSKFVAEFRRNGVLTAAVVAGSPRTLVSYRSELLARYSGES